MNILGLSKKAKKRFSSYKNDRGMRRCKSTGNIYSNAQEANSDSSISSNESDSEDKMKITQKIKDLKVVDNSKEPSVENNKKKVLLSDPKPQSILNTATNTATTTTTPITSPTKPNNDTSSKNPGITISTEEEKVTPKISSCPTSPITNNNNNNNMKLLSVTTATNIQQDDLDALLSLEAQERMDAQLNRDQNEINNKPLRPTTLKFALPEPPVRTISRSKSPIIYPRARPYRSRSAESVDRSSQQQLQQRRHVSPSRKKTNKRHSRWSRLMGSDSDESDSDSDDTNTIKLQIGTKVNLFKRPLPTVGYIRYIGPVDNEIGQWIGVELDHRVGNCDGSIKGKSYFKTGPQRGIFLKEADIEPIH